MLNTGLYYVVARMSYYVVRICSIVSVHRREMASIVLRPVPKYLILLAIVRMIIDIIYAALPANGVNIQLRVTIGVSRSSSQAQTPSRLTKANHTVPAARISHVSQSHADEATTLRHA
ncbi:hypothetical protein EDB80DRAFT_131211 [Ilyonectria destructans]|nr:hypothetical protein EDB80DRAFT_131211 [Ilyonectria destructans]